MNWRPSLPSQYFYYRHFFCICCVIIFCHGNVSYLHFKVFQLIMFVLCWLQKCGLQLWSSYLVSSFACCMSSDTAFCWVCHLCYCCGHFLLLHWLLDWLPTSGPAFLPHIVRFLTALNIFISVFLGLLLTFCNVTCLNEENTIVVCVPIACLCLWCIPYYYIYTYLSVHMVYRGCPDDYLTGRIIGCPACLVNWLHTYIYTLRIHDEYKLLWLIYKIYIINLD